MLRNKKSKCMHTCSNPCPCRRGTHSEMGSCWVPPWNCTQDTEHRVTLGKAWSPQDLGQGRIDPPLKENLRASVDWARGGPLIVHQGHLGLSSGPLSCSWVERQIGSLWAWVHQAAEESRKHALPNKTEHKSKTMDKPRRTRIILEPFFGNRSNMFWWLGLWLSAMWLPSNPKNAPSALPTNALPSRMTWHSLSPKVPPEVGQGVGVEGKTFEWRFGLLFCCD